MVFASAATLIASISILFLGQAPRPINVHSLRYSKLRVLCNVSFKLVVVIRDYHFGHKCAKDMMSALVGSRRCASSAASIESFPVALCAPRGSTGTSRFGDNIFEIPSNLAIFATTAGVRGESLCPRFVVSSSAASFNLEQAFMLSLGSPQFVLTVRKSYFLDFGCYMENHNC